MFKQETVSAAVPAIVEVQPLEVYFPWEYIPGSWLVLCDYVIGEVTPEDGEAFEAHGLRLHLGRRAGQPVKFCRYADAMRLCRVLNGEEAAPC